MKNELLDVTATRRELVVEIPTTEVDRALERVTGSYRRTARIPGFRPGKVPSQVVRQRFRDQILHDVAHELVPRAIDEALRERGLEPVDRPAVRDLEIAEGQPLKFTASFETIPPIDPGDYATISLRRKVATVDPPAVDEAIERLRRRLARVEAVENRGVAEGDTVVVDLERTAAPVPVSDVSNVGTVDEASDASSDTGAPDAVQPVEGGSEPKTESQQNISIEIGNAANPPEFDEHLMGLLPDATTRFSITYPEDHGITELAGATVDYAVEVKAIKRRVLPDLDDEFAKDVGEFDSLEALRERVLDDLRTQAGQEADRHLRADLLRQLAQRVTFELPDTLVERELDGRLEEFVRHLIDQKIDPMKANIDWKAFREEQRPAATDAVRGVLVVDEIARREHLDPTGEEVDQVIERQAAQMGRTVSAVKAQLEKDDALGRVSTGLRREKAIDFVLSHATILAE